jgi:hypothetical protein
VMEVQDAGVFQVAIDDAHHADVVAKPWPPGPQTSDAPHVQPHTHSSLRSDV